MRRLAYVPARDPRHRRAALALYRALVRAAARVPLPPDLAAEPAPLVRLVRRRVARHRPYASARLVYAAMAAGYRFLTLFASARVPGSADNADVVAHVRATLAAAAASRAARPPPPPRAAASAPAPAPLLVKVAAPGEPPRYASSVLPRRPPLPGPARCRVPSLCATSSGQPFVRIAKPQPRVLSKMVGLKDRFFQKKVYRVVEINDDLIPEALLEDEWDRLVAAQGARELDPEAAAAADDDDHDHDHHHDHYRGACRPGYVWPLLVARLWSELQMEKTWEDWVARGTALSRLVDQERALAEQEERGAPPPAPDRPSRPPASAQRPPPNVAVWPHESLPFLSQLRSLRVQHPGAQQSKDPFLCPSWAALVKRNDPKLRAWLGMYLAKNRPRDAAEEKESPRGPFHQPVA